MLCSHEVKNFSVLECAVCFEKPIYAYSRENNFKKKIKSFQILSTTLSQETQ